MKISIIFNDNDFHNTFYLVLKNLKNVYDYSPDIFDNPDISLIVKYINTSMKSINTILGITTDISITEKNIIFNSTEDIDNNHATYILDTQLDFDGNNCVYSV